MSPRKLLTAAALAATALAGLPTIAQAYDGYGHHKHRYYRDGHYEPRRYYRSCRTSGMTGMIVGGAAGALLGRELDGGRNRATGTIVGAGAGALLGREIGRRSHC